MFKAPKTNQKKKKEKQKEKRNNRIEDPAGVRALDDGSRRGLVVFRVSMFPNVCRAYKPQRITLSTKA